MTAQFPTPLHLVTSDSEMTTSKRVTIQNPLIFFFMNTATDIKFFFSHIICVKPHAGDGLQLEQVRKFLGHPYSPL